MSIKSQRELNLMQLIKNNYLDGKELFISPLNEYTSSILNQLEKNGFTCKAIIDNRESVNNKSLRGVKICSFSEQLIPYRPNYVLLFSDTSDDINLIKKLHILGYQFNTQCFDLTKALPPDNFFVKVQRKIVSKLYRNYSSNIKCFKDVSSGFLIYVKIRNSLSNVENKLFLFPHNSIGDIYWLGLFKQSGAQLFSGSYSLVVVGDTCKSVAQEMGFQHVIKISTAEMNNLVIFKNFLGDSLPQIHFLHFMYGFSNISSTILSHKKISFRECYSFLVFNENIKDKSVHVNRLFRHNCNEEIEKYGLVGKKSVVIAPTAKSIPMLSPVFWEQLSNSLKENGFLVFTNVGGEDELPIYGTLPLKCSLSSINNILEYCGYFIGFRSGLCDIISSSSCKKVIIYPKCPAFSNLSSGDCMSTVPILNSCMDFYSLKQLPCATDFIELELGTYPEDPENMEIVHKILLYFEEDSTNNEHKD